MTKEKIILIGGGGHAKACIDVINSTKKFSILGYLDSFDSLDKSFGIKYLGDDSEIYKYTKKAKFLITVGQIKSSNVRSNILKKILENNAQLATVISKSAIVSNYSRIGIGSIIMHHVIVQSGVSIGENCIINDKALIEHDVSVGDNCHISTAAVLNGNVVVGNNSFIGSGAIVKNGLIIGESVLVGIGTVVLNNLEPNSVWIGKLAKSK